MSKSVAPVLVIHGGAGSSRTIDRRRLIAREQALKGILDAVYRALQRGSSALKAVALAVEMLEDDPQFNAGRGSKLQADGKIRMSAALMDGSRRRFAGAVNVEGVRNPIRLSERLLRNPPDGSRVLAGPGAARFARSQQLRFRSPYTDERKREFRRAGKGKFGTVGAVALDSKGRLAAATSTGGRGLEYPHRVSDTPTVAANYANSSCAVSATGVGEEIVDFAVASHLCSLRETGIGVARASRMLKQQADKSRARFGWIALDADGNFYVATTTAHIIWAAATAAKLEVHA
ncbi:MAG: isoaspartyl peptidase/L-asparaginase [Betaproteobacteria bacterium]|nr:isoaspartyl peptidase/L-asparaginase [Betaproteobacteria bacterium]